MNNSTHSIIEHVHCHPGLPREQQIALSLHTLGGLTSGLGALGLIAVGFVLIGFRGLLTLMRALQADRERADALAQHARADRQRLQTVFDHSPEGLVFAEAPAGQISLANPAATALLGPLPSPVPLRDQPWVRRIYRPGGEPYPLDELPLLRTIEHDEACRGVELTVEQPDGQRVPVLLTSMPLHSDDGVLRGAVAVFQDLRLLREVERLKSDFVALISHELRKPLTAIQGCVQTLLSGGEADVARTHEFLQIIAVWRREQLSVDAYRALAAEAGAIEQAAAIYFDRARGGLSHRKWIIRGSDESIPMVRPHLFLAPAD